MSTLKVNILKVWQRFQSASSPLEGEPKSPLKRFWWGDNLPVFLPPTKSQEGFGSPSRGELGLWNQGLTRRLIPLLALSVLAACSSSHRPSYTGREESTDGVPGFVNGKKVSPHVKLGQSYYVDGELYVPRNQPDYVEEGLASWYGPGFHGGKTANGESFDAAELTGAHRTLPLPSIVKVTLLSSGKSAYVRINDRGPFAHKRIIDLSKAAADKIGLVRVGVGRVRVEYMQRESQRFTDLIASGRDPKSIDMASEVIDYSRDGGSEAPRAYAANNAQKSSKDSFWEHVSPVANAQAAEPENLAAEDSAPVAEVTSNDLPAPTAPAAAGKTSPFAPLGKSAPPPAKPVAVADAAAMPARPASAGGHVFVQLGAFASEKNAEQLRKRLGAPGNLSINEKTNTAGQSLYHVRMGPYADRTAAAAVMAELRGKGVDGRIIEE